MPSPYGLPRLRYHSRPYLLNALPPLLPRPLPLMPPRHWPLSHPIRVVVEDHSVRI